MNECRWMLDESRNVRNSSCPRLRLEVSEEPIAPQVPPTVAGLFLVPRLAPFLDPGKHQAM